MSITKYADSTGLTEFWAKVKSHVTSAISGKQDTLVSGTNIKTVNNNSLLGSGDISISGGDYVELTQAEYNALPQSEKENGTVYFITDGVPGSSLPLLNFFYPVGTCYETIDSLFNPNVSMAGTWVLEDEYIVEKRKLLWTNSNSTASFDAQTLNIDLSTFDKIDVAFRMNGASVREESAIAYVGLGASIGIGGTGTETLWTLRVFTTNATGVTFLNGYYAGAVNNAYAIPTRIYGIKFYTHYCWRRTA